MFNPGHPRILVEAADVVSSVVESSTDFWDPAVDAPIVENEVDKKTSHGT